jgi:hypothetical protein
MSVSFCQPISPVPSPQICSSGRCSGLLRSFRAKRQRRSHQHRNQCQAEYDGQCQWRIPASNLPPGNYNLTAAATGFTTATLQNVSVMTSQVRTANLTLEVGGTSTTVQVTEAATQIDTTTAQIQNTFNSKQAADLPNTGIGQGDLNLLLLNAGVSSSGGVGVGTGPSIGGQRPRNNTSTSTALTITASLLLAQ